MTFKKEDVSKQPNIFQTLDVIWWLWKKDIISTDLIEKSLIEIEMNPSNYVITESEYSFQSLDGSAEYSNKKIKD